MNERSKLKNNLKTAFSNLSLDQKRNEFNSELRVINEIINSILISYGEEELIQLYNYKSGIDSKLSEDDVLIQNYMDVLETKNKLILMLSYLTKK